MYTVRTLEVQKNVIRLAKQCNDDYSKAIIQRLEPIPDLIAADGQYHSLCMKHLNVRVPIQGEITKHRGRPKDEVDTCMQFVFSYLENSDEECQFTSDELMNVIQSDNPPHWKTVKFRLLERYGSDIFITSNKSHVVCFKNTGFKIITDAWYEQRLSCEKDERRRIVETAAAIIVEDIRSTVYNVVEYPPTDNLFKGIEALIPETLKVFIDTVVLNKKRGDIDKFSKKSTYFDYRRETKLIYISCTNWFDSFSVQKVWIPQIDRHFIIPRLLFVL